MSRSDSHRFVDKRVRMMFIRDIAFWYGMVESVFQGYFVFLDLFYHMLHLDFMEGPRFAVERCGFLVVLGSLSVFFRVGFMEEIFEEDY